MRLTHYQISMGGREGSPYDPLDYISFPHAIGFWLGFPWALLAMGIVAVADALLNLVIQRSARWSA